MGIHGIPSEFRVNSVRVPRIFRVISVITFVIFVRFPT